MRQEIQYKDLIKTKYSFNNKPVFINPEYKKLVPRPEIEQKESMRESLKDDGLHEPLTINKENIILDGHTRIELCDELSLEPRFKVKEFNDITEERKYVMIVNLKRRHLNPLQIVELTLDLYEKIRDRSYKEQLENISKTNGGKQEKIGSRKERTTAIKYGKEIGVSKSNIEKSLFILKNGDDKLISSVRNGEKSLSSAYKELSGEMSEQDMIKEKTKKLEEKIEYDKKPYRSTLGIVYSILDILEQGGTEGVIISALSRCCNLSHYAALEHCELLRKNKLVETFKVDRNRIFKLNEKGIEFKKQCDRFVEQLKKYHLEKEF